MSAYLAMLKFTPAGKSFEEAEKEQEQEARNAYNKFITGFHKKRIFVGKELCKKIDTLLNAYNECYKKYYKFINLKDSDIDRDLRREFFNDYKDSMNKMENEIPQALDEIEQAFRSDYSEY